MLSTFITTIQVIMTAVSRNNYKINDLYDIQKAMVGSSRVVPLLTPEDVKKRILSALGVSLGSNINLEHQYIRIACLRRFS